MQTLLGISGKYWSSLWLKMENYIEIMETEKGRNEKRNENKAFEQQ